METIPYRAVMVIDTLTGGAGNDIIMEVETMTASVVVLAVINSSSMTLQTESTQLQISALHKQTPGPVSIRIQQYIALGWRCWHCLAGQQLHYRGNIHRCYTTYPLQWR